MISPQMCPDCRYYYITACPHCDSIIGHCKLNNQIYPHGSCSDFMEVMSNALD